MKEGRTKEESERSGDVGRIIRTAEMTEITSGNGENEKRNDWVRKWFGEYNNQTDRIEGTVLTLWVVVKIEMCIEELYMVGRVLPS